MPESVTLRDAHPLDLARAVLRREIHDVPYVVVRAACAGLPSEEQARLMREFLAEKGVTAVTRRQP